MILNSLKPFLTALILISFSTPMSAETIDFDASPEDDNDTTIGEGDFDADVGGDLDVVDGGSGDGSGDSGGGSGNDDVSEPGDGGEDSGGGSGDGSGGTTVPVAFVCDGEAYTVRDTPADLYIIDQNVDPFLFVPIKTPIVNEGINNIGYRLVDNLLYGVKVQSGTNNVNLGLVKIDSAGNVFDVTTQFTSGTYAGQPLQNFPQIFAAGDIDTEKDVMYLNHYSLQNNFLEVDLATGDITQKFFILPNPFTGKTHTGKTIADWAVNPVNGKLYGADGNRCVNGFAAVYELDPVALTVTSLGGVSGLPCGNHSSPAYGGSWFDAQGNFFAYQNGPDIIYKVDLASKQVVGSHLGDTGGSNNNDAAACAAGVPLIDKFYTYTNNNWEPVCIDEQTIDGETACFEYEAANLDSGAVFADELPTNTDGEYVLYGKELGKKTAITPGQYIAVSEITNLKAQDIWVKEDFSDCVDVDGIGLVNPNKVPGGVQVVLIDPDGYVDPIDGDLANGIGGSIQLESDYALIHVQDVPVDYTVRVMVKFQPFSDLGMIGRNCTNHEILLNADGEEIGRSSAVLVVEPKP